MNLPQLYYFRKLAEVQHYTEAAKALYITQPSLSDSIASLEKELGVSLFQKKGRNIQLTKYGEEFYQYVSESLSILEHGISLIKEKSGHISGTIDIGCILTLLGDFLPEALDLYQEKNPLATLNIYQECPSRWRRAFPAVNMTSASVPWWTICPTWSSSPSPIRS